MNRNSNKIYHCPQCGTGTYLETGSLYWGDLGICMDLLRFKPQDIKEIISNHEKS